MPAHTACEPAYLDVDLLDRLIRLLRSLNYTFTERARIIASVRDFGSVSCTPLHDEADRDEIERLLPWDSQRWDDPEWDEWTWETGPEGSL